MGGWCYFDEFCPCPKNMRGGRRAFSLFCASVLLGIPKMVHLRASRETPVSRPTVEGARQWESEEVMLLDVRKGSSFISLSLRFSVCIVGPCVRHRLLGGSDEAVW